MSGLKCVYFGCNLTPRIDPTIRLFSFPVKDIERCRQWIINSGNEKLSFLSLDVLKKKRICSKHFDEVYRRTRNLTCHAVPTPYGYEYNNENKHDSEEDSWDFQKVLNTTGHIAVYPSPSWKFKKSKIEIGENQPSTEIPMNWEPHADIKYKIEGSSLEIEENRLPKIEPTEWESYIDIADESERSFLEKLQYSSIQSQERKQSLEEEKMCLKKQLLIENRKTEVLNLQLQRLKNKIKKIQLSENLRFQNSKRTKFSKIFLKMQERLKFPGIWSQSERKLALSIYNKSPSCYKFLRQKGIVLPSVITLQN